MDWLTLLLLVPLVVIPVVFLSGFAGCNWIFGLEDTESRPPRPPPPSDLMATAIGTDRIQLSWKDNSTNTTHFSITRTEDPEHGGTTITIEEGVSAIPGTPPIPNTYLDDSGLTEASVVSNK